MIRFIETFTSAVITPAVMLLLLIAGAAVYACASPHKVALCFLKNRKERGGNSLSATLTALAGTLGVGNISGVALAIAYGGCGAVFWMWISAFFAMAVKYAEILLASHYRIKKKNGYHGGAPIYLRAAFRGKTGRCLSAFFAALCILASLTVGSSVQSLAAAESAKEAFGIPPILTGAALAVCAFLCTVGGSRRIEKVTGALVPIMSGAYLILSLYIILCELENIPHILSLIMRSAFGIRPAIGGIGAFGMLSAVRYGVSRGLISNEAGCGTAPFAHARAAREPAEQGLFGILEVFIDTVVLCTATAVCIIAAYGNSVPADRGGMILVSNAFEKYLGAFAPTALCIAVVMFAYGSLICWYFYATECISMITGAKWITSFFSLAFILATALGSVSGGGVWLISDVCINLMLTTNTAAVLKELNTVRRVSTRYISSFSSNSAERTEIASSIRSRGKASAMPHSETEAP